MCCCQNILNNSNYNIPRACLLNRWPVPAMVLKSSRSSLWRHIIETCCRLRCRKHSNDVEQHDIKSILLSHDKNVLLSCRSYIMLRLLYIKELQYMHFQFDCLCIDTTCDTFFTAVVRYIIKHLFYETAWSILFWGHKNDVTNILRRKFDWACDGIFMASK